MCIFAENNTYICYICLPGSRAINLISFCYTKLCPLKLNRGGSSSFFSIQPTRVLPKLRNDSKADDGLLSVRFVDEDDLITLEKHLYYLRLDTIRTSSKVGSM